MIAISRRQILISGLFLWLFAVVGTTLVAFLPLVFWPGFTGEFKILAFRIEYNSRRICSRFNN